jgi:hypothetical protein
VQESGASYITWQGFSSSRGRKAQHVCTQTLQASLYIIHFIFNSNLSKFHNYVMFQVLTAASMKMVAVWVVAPYDGWVIALMMEAASTSETLVNFYQTTRRNNPEANNLS